MSKRDRYGLVLSTSSEDAANHFIVGLDGILASNAGAAEHFARAIDADPQFALAHFGLGQALVQEGRPGSAGSFLRAFSLGRKATRRERQLLLLATLRATNDAEGAQALTRAHLSEFPRDAFVLLMSVGNLFFLGGPGKTRTVAELLASLEDAYRDDWFFNGMHAFALQEIGEHERAERLAGLSLDANPKNADAAHALAHVFHARRDHSASRSFLEPWIDRYAGTMRGHLGWHLALLDLEQGEHQRVRERYGNEVIPGKSRGPDFLVLADAVHLAWRYRSYASGETALPTSEVHALAKTLAAEPSALTRVLGGPARLLVSTAKALARSPWLFGPAMTMLGLATLLEQKRPGPFVHVHAALAFALEGDAEGLSALAAALEPRDGAERSIAGTLVRAVSAFGRGSFDEAALMLEAVSDEELEGMGGSAIERDLFAELRFVAQMSGGRTAIAARTLDELEAREPRLPLPFWLLRLQRQLARGS